MSLKRFLFSYLIIFIFLGCKSGDNEKAMPANVIENKKTIEIEPELKVCMFSTKNDSKSEGINMDLPYPCDWTVKSGQNQNVVKKFEKLFTDGSAIEELLVISNIGKSLSAEEINYLLSEKIISEGMDSDKDIAISFERLEINGKPAAKMVYESKVNNLGDKIFSKIDQVFVYHNQCLIRIQLATFSRSKEKSESLYNEFKDLFTRLATSTKFHDN